MQIKTIPSKWLENNGRRLDCGPYMSGAIEARELLRHLHTEPLKNLTAGHNGGIYNGPQFSRNYVDDPEHGVPFLTTSSMLHSDMSTLALISKKDAYSSKLRYLEVKEGMTLITCSGTIGRMAYARKEMNGCWSNQDIMKIVADSSKIEPGYLYAYLRSRFGVPLVISGTYGAIIQHIEPGHLVDLPVPRIGDVEENVHKMIQQSADELSESARLMREATHRLLSEAGLQESENFKYLSDESRTGWAENSFSTFSLRALNYDPRSNSLWKAVESINHSKLGDVVSRDNFEGYIVFSRIDCEPEHGSLLIGQKEAFFLRPTGRWISKKSIKGLGLVVPAKTTVIPCQGTLGESEVYCRAVYVTTRCSEYAYSGHFYRCEPIEEGINPGYLYAFLRSRYAFRMMRSISIGSKQQYQHPQKMANFPVPRLELDIETEIGELVDRAAYLQDHSLELEDQAIALVEHAIEEGGC